MISACARSGANQLLLIIDSCYSGEAVEASSPAAAILEQNPPDSKRIWVGVLTSCLKLQTAANGLHGERLRHLLEDGPEDSDLRVRWSRHNEQIRGDDLCDAVLKEWTSGRQQPEFQGRGDGYRMLPNPLFTPRRARRGGGTPKMRRTRRCGRR